MPWFSRKKKRKNKRVVVNTSKDDSVVTTASSQPLFAVVVQRFEASVSDEVTVERGQVVESLFSQENWIYVRNVDGQCGYVPSNFCFPLDRLRMGLSTEKSNEVNQLRAHPRPTTIHVDNFECPTAGEEGEGVQEGEEDEVVNSPDSGISCSQPTSSTNMESVHSFHNSREGGERRLAASRSHQQALPAVGEAESNNIDRTQSHTQLITRSSNRHGIFFNPNSLPLLETATLPPVSSEQSERRHSPSPSPPPLPPVSPADFRQRRGQGSNEQLLAPQPPNAANANSEEAECRSNRSSDGDDVFLPEAGKPVGIYQIAETYEPKFQGEMALQRDEIVVVMEVGKGEWVWAVGSENKEGLVPKSLLHKYRPDIPEEEEAEEDGLEGEVDEREEEGEGGEVVCEEESEGAAVTRRRSEGAYDVASSSTQTELIVDGIVREVSCSVPPRRHSHTHADTHDMASVSIQTEFTSPDWFKNNTPTTTPHHTLTRSTTTTTAATTTSTATNTPPKHLSHTTPLTHSSAATAVTAPLKLLCNPRSSHSHSPASTPTAPRPAIAAAAPAAMIQLSELTSSSGSPSARTQSGRYLPLTPASTPQKPSISLQSPSSTGARTLLDMSATTRETETAGLGTAIAATPQQQQQYQAHGVRSNLTPGVRRQQNSSSAAAGVGGSGTLQRHRHALRQHERIVDSIPFEPDNDATTNCTQSAAVASRRRLQPTPIVTAVRDYAPPRQANNALTLHKGDIMYAQPHVPYPQGWVWVYHTLLKKYGYAPKEYIAYMYLVQKNQATVLEHLV